MLREHKRARRGFNEVVIDALAVARDPVRFVQAFFLVQGAATHTPHKLVRDKRLGVTAVRKTNEGVVEAHKRFLAEFNLTRMQGPPLVWLRLNQSPALDELIYPAFRQASSFESWRG